MKPTNDNAPKAKRPDLRTPLAERHYNPVERPIMLTVPKGFQPPATEPCKECPLARTALPGALGGYTVEQYLEVLRGPADLACHMSPGFPDDIERQRSCTGVAMFRANCGIVPDGRGAREAMQTAGPNGTLAFGSEAEFALHHTKND